MVRTDRKVFFVLAAFGILLLATVIGVVSEDQHDHPSLPEMTIVTEDSQPVVSKDVYVDCTISVGNTGGVYDLAETDGEIRGRGNSTWDVPSYWYMPKKPYRVSFDEPVDLFGNGAATDWTLIANYSDPSLCRNMLAYGVAEAVGAPYTTSTQCVNLYLNGIFQGVYLVCEQTEVGENRVDIHVDYTDPETSGYLLEMDEAAPGDQEFGDDYFDLADRHYRVRDNKGSLGWSKAAFDYISSWTGEAWDALNSGDEEKAGEYVDFGTFAMTYVVNEMFHTQDVTDASFFMYKEPGGKLFSGPVWDFDNSSGNATNLTSKDPDKLWAADQNPWYAALLKYDGFREEVRSVLEEKDAAIRAAVDDGISYAMANHEDFEYNFSKWPTIGALTGSNPLEFLVMENWQDNVWYLKDWLMASLDHMREVYCG